MLLSRIGMLSLEYMLVSKGLLTAMGLIVSLFMRWLYRSIQIERKPLWRMLITATVVSYVLGVLWSVVFNAVEPLVVTWAGVASERHARLSVMGSVYHAFALLAWSFLYAGIKQTREIQKTRERVLRAEAGLHEARLEALRYQINPHFLFNTLNGLSTLVGDGEIRRAQSMIARLGDFLRLTMSLPATETVLLGDEVTYARNYLDIERMRFGDRLQVEWDLDPAAMHNRVPLLLLQPLLENAIKHGISRLAEGGSIKVSSERRNDYVVIVVENHAPLVESEERGVGLSNTKSRIEALYGGQGRFSFLPPRHTGDRARVEIHLPVETS